MKRRTFLKSIIGAISTVAVPSLVSAKTKLDQQISDSNAPCSRPKMKKDNTSIWNVSWGEDSVYKIHSKEVRGDEAKQYLKDMEEAMLKVVVI